MSPAAKMAGFVVLISVIIWLFLWLWGIPATQMPTALGIAGVILIGYALFAYFSSTSVVLSISGAHQVTKEEEWEFVREGTSWRINGVPGLEACESAE